MVLLFLLLGFSSCYKYNKPDKPKNLIPKEKMIHVLLDLKFVGAITGKDKEVLDSAKVNPEGYVYKKYGIDSTQFAESNAYYAYYMDEYAEIYENVKDSLTKLKAYYMEILEKERQEKKKADSLKAVKQELEAKELEAEIDMEELELIEPVSDTDSLSLKLNRQ